MSILQSLATTLLNTYGTNLSDVAVVFPNKRASLFLNEELVRLSDRPLWSPAYITISDLFRSHSDLQVADPIKLVCDLHKSFVQCTGMESTLDHFYGWGQLLLSDFDDVDKHMVPADKVFANLRDIHEFDNDTYLTQNQRDIIRKFFSNFSEDHNSELKQRFLSLWSHIGDIYHDFNKRLTAQGLAYEGALYRQVAEKETLVFEHKQYVFAGFNLLHPVEQALIRRLEAEGKARLIQDSDEESPKHITFISAPTENIQARYVSTWLKENERIQAGRKTAIVLSDERLLQSVIHCIPDQVSKVNITTGYPLSQTAIASTIHGDWPSKLINSIKASAQNQTDPLEIEAHFRLYTLLTRLQSLVESGDLQVTLPTFQRLLSQLINSTSIPFHGEPLEGIQVMGVLETRNIDFDHVLLLSCNEGNFPKGINDTSFIPYSIRKAYGLTTVDNKVAIYAHYFRRLLQRASDVTLVYNNSTNDGKTGEMSRFMLQLMVESKHPITYLTLQAGQTPRLHHPLPIPKTPEVMERLKNIRQISPSALSRYLRCPLQFFYHYVNGLSEFEDPEDDLIDNRLFGNIFHKAAQNLYASRSTIDTSFLESLLKSKVEIEQAVDQAIKLELFHIEDPTAKMPPLNGLQLINRQVIIRYIRQLLEVDLRLTPFTILGLECPTTLTGDRYLSGGNNAEMDLTGTCPLSGCPPSAIMQNPDRYLSPVRMSPVRIGGIIDRLDKVTLPDGTERIRVVDYKTGSSRLKPLPDIAAIFDPANIRNHSDYYLQTFLYAISIQERVEEPVSPCLLFIQHAGTDQYDPTLIIGKTPVTDISTVKDEFMQHLDTLLAEILNPDTPFLPTQERAGCRSCPFLQLCGY